MKRWIPLGIIFILVLILAGCLFRTVVASEEYTGEWYSCSDASLYVFRNGVLECTDHYIEIAEEERISGAYSFCRDSIAVFAIGVDGLEEVRQLYLVNGANGPALCENPNGSGRIFFCRNREDAAIR